VIDAEGEQLGVMSTDRAIALAMQDGLDLVEVSPTARPPVCRIMDFGKFKYEQSKKQKESKKKQHTVQVKEIKLRPKTEEHDYQFKMRHAHDFLEKGNKVKVTLMFRGRELDHRELGEKMLGRLQADLADVGTVERPATMEGRLMVMYMAPIPGKPKPKEKRDRTVAATNEIQEEENDAQTQNEQIGTQAVQKDGDGEVPAQ
jgi:translation initiation factor IF-3